MKPAPTDLDRWIISELNVLIEYVDLALDDYDPTGAARRIEDFVDGLSNWYVRRSRRRFWKSENDADKAAAYATLYTCLVTLSKLLAPFAPFVAEELYQNLVRSVDEDAPESVHLASFPVADLSLVDEDLAAATRLAMKVASLGRAARSKAGVKVRQPVGRVLVKTRYPAEGEGLRRVAQQVLEELNAKELDLVAEADLYFVELRPNPGLIDSKSGFDPVRVGAALRAADFRAVAAALASGEEVSFGGFTFYPEELRIEVKEPPGLSLAAEGDYIVAIDTRLTPELRAEGLARELVHRLQTMRRAAGFEVADRIVTYHQAPEEVARVIRDFADYIAQETLSLELVAGMAPEDAHRERVKLEGLEVVLGVKRAT